jgi:hypothetical protein
MVQEGLGDIVGGNLAAQQTARHVLGRGRPVRGGALLDELRRQQPVSNAVGSMMGLFWLPAQPSRFSERNRSWAAAGFRFWCTTAWTAAIIAFGVSDWKMLRPMSTPAAPCCTAL